MAKTTGEIIAQAKGYIISANRLEEAGGDKKKIASLYQTAAEKYVNAYKLSNDDRYAELAEKYSNLASLYHPKIVEKEVVVEGGMKEKGPKEFALFEPTITFDGVAGMREAKKEIERAIVWPLTNPNIYKVFVGNASQGILLYGPPGCGKTYLAEAAAGEANKRFGEKIYFLNIRISDIQDSLVGESQKNIRAAFESAAEHAPAILFFDEIDGLGGTRGEGDQKYSRELVNEFLTSFSIIRNKPVLVIGATNFPWLVDPALRRPGRLGKNLLVPPPDLEARLELFRIYSKNKRIAQDINYQKLAAATENYSCVDVREIVMEAGRIALDDYFRQGANGRKIEQKDLEVALGKIKSSLYIWCETAKKQTANATSGDEGLIELINEILEVKKCQ